MRSLAAAVAQQCASGPWPLPGTGRAQQLALAIDVIAQVVLSKASCAAQPLCVTLVLGMQPSVVLVLQQARSAALALVHVSHPFLAAATAALLQVMKLQAKQQQQQGAAQQAA